MLCSSTSWRRLPSDITQGHVALPGILSRGEVAERLKAALLKSAESKDFVGSNPTLSATP
jgi:hypothetical protein